MTQLIRTNATNTVPTAPTMSSLEIARLTGKAHHNVIKEVRRILEQAGIDELTIGGTYLDTYGREQPCYYLPKRECDLFMASHSPSACVAAQHKGIEVTPFGYTTEMFSKKVFKEYLYAILFSNGTVKIGKSSCKDCSPRIRTHENNAAHFGIQVKTITRGTFSISERTLINHCNSLVGSEGSEWFNTIDYSVVVQYLEAHRVV